jgi:hypothetical protein
MKASDAVFSKQACDDLSTLGQAVIRRTPYIHFREMTSGKESWDDAFS